MKKFFYGILATGSILLFLSAVTFTPSRSTGAMSDVPSGPSLLSNFTGLVIASAFFSLSCIATYYAIKNLKGLKMLVSVILSWILPVFGPSIVFCLSYDHRENSV